jgi:hypothetical protein
MQQRYVTLINVVFSSAASHVTLPKLHGTTLDQDVPVPYCSPQLRNTPYARNTSQHHRQRVGTELVEHRDSGGTAHKVAAAAPELLNSLGRSLFSFVVHSLPTYIKFADLGDNTMVQKDPQNRVLISGAVPRGSQCEDRNKPGRLPNWDDERK